MTPGKDPAPHVHTTQEGRLNCKVCPPIEAKCLCMTAKWNQPCPVHWFDEDSEGPV